MARTHGACEDRQGSRLPVGSGRQRGRHRSGQPLTHSFFFKHINKLSGKRMLLHLLMLVVLSMSLGLQTMETTAETLTQRQ